MPFHNARLVGVRIGHLFILEIQKRCLYLEHAIIHAFGDVVLTALKEGNETVEDLAMDLSERTEHHHGFTDFLRPSWGKRWRLGDLRRLLRILYHLHVWEIFNGPLL